MHFASSKCKCVLQDLTGAKPNLGLGGEHMGQMDRLDYLGSCASPGGCILDEMFLFIQKVGLTSTKLRDLWRWWDIRLLAKGRVYIGPMRSVLLCGFGTRILRAKDTQGRLSVLENGCLHKVDKHGRRMSAIQRLDLRYWPLGSKL